MGIEIRQQGEPALYAKAGQLIGKAQKAEKEEQLAFQREQTLLEIAERRRVEQASRDWELQKAMLNSQQDFAHEQRLHQIELEREARSKEWELEKMELRSRLDFQKEEQERQKVIDEATIGLNALDKAIKSGKFTGNEPEIQRLQLQYQMQKDTGQTSTHVQSLLTPEQRRRPITVIDVQKRLAAVLGGADMVAGQTIPEMLSDAESQGIDTSTLFEDFDITPYMSKKPVEPKVLDTDVAKQILKEAGGNKDRARQIARQRGYTF